MERRPSFPAGWRKKNRPFTWLSLDEEDNDKIRFLSYLIAAIQKIDVKIGMSAASVLDDYHSIHDEQIHSDVEFLCK